MSKIIDIISELVEITGNGTIDSILFAIAGFIAFSVAFGLVGIIFDFIGNYDSDLMSDTHWLIRTIIFIFLTWLFVKIFEFFTWLFSFEWWVYLLAAIVIILIILAVFFIKGKISSSKNKEKIINTNTQPINQQMITPPKKECCPRCGGKLVKRHGPYGDFYGCENYSKSNCRYTRKFL